MCTGALLLGAAGLLDGLRRDDALGVHRRRSPRYGAEATSERVVAQGKVITSAGVSSGIDMALTLAAAIAGDDVAQAIQLADRVRPRAAVRHRVDREGARARPIELARSPSPAPA